MLSRMLRAPRDLFVAQSGRATAWVRVARSVLTTAHSAFALIGLIAISAAVAMFVKPEAVDRLIGFSPFFKAVSRDAEMSAPQNLSFVDQPTVAAEVRGGDDARSGNEAAGTAAVDSRQQQRVANWISKRYRIAGDATNLLVSAAYLTAQETKLDPLLILAVVAIESSFNPFAESAVGAQGLMQVMSKLHHKKFEELGGVKAALNPIVNIKVGSLILKDYVTQAGSLEAGLKQYVGAAAYDSDSGYGARVLSEYNRLKQVAMGKPVPAFVTTAAAPSRKPAPVTTPPSTQKPEPSEEAEAAAAVPKLPPKAESDRVAAL